VPAGVVHHPDPGIAHGAFRVLPRTDGLWVVVDERRPPGYRTVGKPFKSQKAAELAAKTWHAQGHG
jgi:hypothetical protein